MDDRPIMSSSEKEDVVALTEDSPDFSQPWLLSDVVLVVEEKKFHVHRSMLAVWSPVFAKMFTTQFREENADEIPLPAKKADEISEMLAVIYPTFEREVDENNCLSFETCQRVHDDDAHQEMRKFLVKKIRGFTLLRIP